MIDLQLPKGKAVFYDDIKLLPMEQLNAFQIHLLQDSGIGSTILDYDRHEERIDMFLATGKIAEVIEERKNKRYNFWLMIQKLNTKSLAICCLLQSIEGQEIRDFSDEGLKRHSEKLADLGITLFEIEQLAEEVKKKSIGI